MKSSLGNQVPFLTIDTVQVIEIIPSANVKRIPEM